MPRSCAACFERPAVALCARCVCSVASSASARAHRQRATRRATIACAVAGVLRRRSPTAALMASSRSIARSASSARKPRKRPSALGAGELALQKFAAEPALRRDKHRPALSSVTALTTSRPPRRAAPTSRSRSGRARSTPPPTKMASGCSRSCSASGASPSTISMCGNAEVLRRCGECGRSARGRARWRRARIGGVGEQPFDGDRAGAGADVP